MADRDYKAFIVEGEAREPLIIDNISKIFFSHGNFKIITLPAGKNIYMLWKQMKEDDFDTDIIEVLREDSDDLQRQLNGFSRDDFSEVYLFFDYDAHQNNLKDEDGKDVLEQMLISFDNETENGKLYISYPMVEALRDFEAGVCGHKNDCFIAISDIGTYKHISAVRSSHPQFKEYNFLLWKEVIDVFVMRISCLIGQADVISYEKYRDEIDPYTIYIREVEETDGNGVFILSAFPEFLLDYFGIRLWKTCVRHRYNQLNELECR